MSDENKFFRFVWRFNALVIALLCLGAIVLVGIAAFDFWIPRYIDKPQGHFAPVPKEAEAENTYRLKDSGSIGFMKPGGGQEVFLVFSLGDWEGAPNAYALSSVSSSGSMRFSNNANLLLVSTGTGKGQWLFHGVGRNIVNWDWLIDYQAKSPVDVSPAGPQVISPNRLYGDRQAVEALVLKVIDQDTDKDGKLTDEDGLTLYAVSRLDGTEPVKLLDADLILSQTQIGKDRYVIGYETGGKAYIAVYSVPDFALVTKKPLPKLPQ